MGGNATFMPVVGRPGEAGALTLDGADQNYLSMAGPTWRNEIDASVGLQLAMVVNTVGSGNKAPLSAAGPDRRLRSVRSGRLDSQVGGAGEGRSPA